MEPLISLNMNIGLLLCLVLSAGLSASSVSKYERNNGEKRERVRRSPQIIACSNCEELTETSGVVGSYIQTPGTLINIYIYTIYVYTDLLIYRKIVNENIFADRDCSCNDSLDACLYKRGGYYFCYLRWDDYRGCRHKRYDRRARAYYSLSACYDNYD